MQVQPVTIVFGPDGDVVSVPINFPGPARVKFVSVQFLDDPTGPVVLGIGRRRKGVDEALAHFGAGDPTFETAGGVFVYESITGEAIDPSAQELAVEAFGCNGASALVQVQFDLEPVAQNEYESSREEEWVEAGTGLPLRPALARGY